MKSFLGKVQRMTKAEIVISVGVFVKQILKTDIAEAAGWIENSKARFPKGFWDDFLMQAITKDSLQWFMDAVPIQITSSIRILHAGRRNYKEMLEHGEAFLQEILQKAINCGVDVSDIHIFPIFKPN